MVGGLLLIAVVTARRQRVAERHQGMGKGRQCANPFCHAHGVVEVGYRQICLAELRGQQPKEV